MLKRPKTKESVCKECFYRAFEEEIHQTIVNEKLFTRGDRVAIGAPGGIEVLGLMADHRVHAHTTMCDPPSPSPPAQGGLGSLLITI